MNALSSLVAGRPPFRADHIGSLLRPASLRQAFKQRSAGSIGEAEFTRIQDESILNVLRLQESAGLKLATDGEFRRHFYWSRLAERVDGIEMSTSVYSFEDDAGRSYEFAAPYTSKKLQRSRPVCLDEFDFVKANTKLTPKVTLPSPSTMHFYRCSDFGAKSAYPEPELFFKDLCKVYREEITALAAAGCTYVQLDEVPIALLCDPAIREKVKSVEQDPDRLVDLYIDAINQAVSALPSGIQVGVHMCRGNLKGHYFASGGYESIAERFFGSARVNHFLLEFDSERAGSFAPLRFVPKEVGVVLGIVSSKTPQLEKVDDLRRRVEQATEYIDINRLAISPQCGFASTASGNPVTEADECAKLKLCVDVAGAIWGGD